MLAEMEIEPPEVLVGFALAALSPKLRFVLHTTGQEKWLLLMFLADWPEHQCELMVLTR